MERIMENSNYQKFKETIDDFITKNLTKEKPITMICRQLQDNSIVYKIISGNIKETINMYKNTKEILKMNDKI